MNVSAETLNRLNREMTNHHIEDLQEFLNKWRDFHNGFLVPFFEEHDYHWKDKVFEAHEDFKNEFLVNIVEGMR